MHDPVWLSSPARNMASSGAGERSAGRPRVAAAIVAAAVLGGLAGILAFEPSPSLRELKDNPPGKLHNGTSGSVFTLIASQRW